MAVSGRSVFVFFLLGIVSVHCSSELTTEEQTELLEQIKIDSNEDVFDVEGFKTEIANSMRYWDNGTEIFIQVDNPGEEHLISDENLGKTDERTADGSELQIPSNDTIVKRKIWAQKGTLWTNGFIPYCFTPGYFTYSEKQKVRAGIAKIMATTCLRYSERSYCEKKGKMIRYSRAASGCSSGVGQGTRGTGTNLGLKGTNACMNTGTIIHETLHATGCWHEQERTDRSAYVIVAEIEYTVDPSQYAYGDTIDNVPFDYRSVMAYGGSGSRGRPAMFTIDPEMDFATTGGNAITFYDKKQLNDIYKCAARCGANRCLNEGYLDKNCKCVCPDFVRGADCGQVTTGCGGIIHVSGNKVLTSPGYPRNYRNGLTCAWLVKAPKGSIMTIKFLDFDVEGSPTGCKDSLEVRYHGLGNVGPRYCGRGVKKTFETMFNNAMLVLRTNSGGQRRGFKLQIDLKKDHSCNPNPCKNGGKCVRTLYGLIMCKCPFENVAGRWCEHSNGAWSPWGGWSNCPGRCGLQTRRRLCNSPARSGRGLPCYGNSVDSKPCGQWPCDGKNESSENLESLNRL
ncbi:protein SpAN-like [Tubulanus polymorphus]|uniref:protein SpAN-like n=1 Tax=Tubulanus polymorphus TaxID=672921 RepID=UPI003DA41B68